MTKMSQYFESEMNMTEFSIQEDAEKLSLIQGKFEIPEVRDSLIQLYNHMIKHYKLMAYVSQIRYDKDDEFAENMIHKLTGELNKVHEMIHEAKKQNKSLLINSQISISLCDD